MSNKPTKGVANVTRQTWDRAHYERLAQLRANGQIANDNDKKEKKSIRSSKPEFVAAEEGIAGPLGSFLQVRQERVALDDNVGRVRVVVGEEAAKNNGYHCEVCDLTLKDSVAYLDHINGKRHLQRLGYSMRVERSTVDQVKNRLQNAAKRKYDPILTKKLDALEEYEKKRKEAEEEEIRRKRQKKENQKGTAKQEETATLVAVEKKDESLPPVDEEMMAMMGFGGFGGSKKHN